ncbi:MAG: type II secretion system minor pseudopilin GspJ [Magnetococcales bacterium]|nr:type II secretion system minor pseudopilin GspJ [Magnetococcales bacterium]
MNSPLLMQVKQRGFTLLEVLAALAVFAVMSAMAYGGLNALLQARAQGMQKMEELGELRTFFLFFSKDVEQLIARGAWDGSRRLAPALVGRDGASQFLELTRSGRPNLRALPRSGLERVGYALEEGKLVRRAWPALDRVSDAVPEAEILLEQVSEIEIRFMGGDGQWRGDWPPVVAPAGGGGGGQPPYDPVVAVPRAVEIVVRKEGWGRVRRLFEMAGAR